MSMSTRIPEATIREEWAVAVTQLWARALGGAVERARSETPAAVAPRRAYAA